MSLEALHATLYRLKNDSEALAAFKASREKFVERLELSDAERLAVTKGDIPALWQLGVHPLLLIPFSRMIGIPASEYRVQLGPFVGARAIRNEVP